jgi:hypothetical protein
VRAFGIRHLACGVLLMTAVGCGKKGPPLAPLVIAPAVVADLSASRFGDRVIIRFTPPEKNTDNTTPADLSRVEIYALSAESAAAAPEAGVVVREGARVEPAGPRTFAEPLTAEALKAWTPKRPAPPSPPVTPSPEKSETAAPPQPVRVYALVPVSARGRRGPATLATASLAPAPEAPPPPAVAYTETTIAVRWLADQGGMAYNVYDMGSPRAAGSTGSTGSSMPGAPLNEAPLKEPAFEDKRVEFGKTRCYSVTAVTAVDQRRVESPLSAPACVTPVDTFAPAAPTGLAAVAGPGSIGLIWDASSAPDLAGYLVLRGEAADATLQALTPEPIKETTYRDTAVTPGTRYVYVVVAVDASKNTSAQSARVEETAR